MVRPSVLSRPGRSRLLPLMTAQLFDGAGGRFSSLLLGLWAAQVAGIRGFSHYAMSGLLGSALAALVLGAALDRLPGRLILLGSVSGLVVARIGAYSAVGFGFGLEALYAFTFLGSVFGTLMVNAVKVYVPDDGTASVSFAWIGLAGSIGMVIGSGLAGVAGSLGSSTWLVMTGLPVAAASLVPMFRLTQRAADAPLREVRGMRAVADAVHRVRPRMALVVLIGSAMTGIDLIRDGVVAELYSGNLIGLVAVASLLGGLVAAKAVPYLVARWGRMDQDPLVWPILAAVSAAGWALVGQGIVWLIVGQVVAGAMATARSALAEARLLQLAGRESIAFVSSLRDALVGVVGALALWMTPALIGRFGYGGTGALIVVGLLGMALIARSPRVTAPARRAL